MFHQLVKTLLIPLLFLAACGSSNKQAKHAENKADSLIDNNESMSKPPPPGPGLSPGHARISGSLVSIKENVNSGDKKLLIFHVDKVMEYGSATPPIASGDTLNISISEKGLDENDTINSEENLILVIEHLQRPSIGEQNGDIWVFRKLITD